MTPSIRPRLRTAHRRTPWLIAWALYGLCTQAQAASDWPAWDGFAGRFLQADGRIIDLTFERKSTSEGQSYGLFFALVANDRARFDTMLKWTSDNLAEGQLGQRLPAWLWGLREDGRWGVKDPNAASDGDLWIAYSLLEAARLWNAPHYADTGRRLLAQVQAKEVAQAGASGPVLLSGPVGFVLDKGRFRINPSYLPGFMFRYLAVVDPQGPWQPIWDGYLRLAPQIFSAGVAPDNLVVDSAGRAWPDSEAAPSGSYDGIRVYLWAGMSGPGSAALVKRLAPFAALTRQLGAPPEKVNPLTGAALRADYSPIGYSGALLPFLSALGDTAGLARERERVRNAPQNASSNYYDRVLVLFGTGWIEGHYRFDEKGRLLPRWSTR
ncbi:cellulose synthase complex periplasmic endoglucanase BcsZ [uncultured Piscinibacter sp.]|uniref:cellulose synthase complex periplasmic endoglucanase BcsZ n=1 Tax=uncultured Piscinibacter sp. TaxID=1131835 RepID=UPI0026134A6D|nr:cellulose synthase complex periplasmic endoglucanase BcsZ [uncultured Piscinibacter sp.]